MNNKAITDDMTAEIIITLEEEIEEKIAAGKTFNHNQTLVRDSDAISEAVEIEIEELETIVAPAIVRNHNETLVRDKEN